MKIYQLHRYSGEYEDFLDSIVGSYIRKERAEEEKTKRETKEKELTERSDKCINCPFYGEDFDNLNDLMCEHPNYCNEAKLVDDEEYGMDCKNYYAHWDKATFKIKEVEVEE